MHSYTRSVAAILIVLVLLTLAVTHVVRVGDVPTPAQPKHVDLLVRDLSSTDPAVRAEAARALGQQAAPGRAGIHALALSLKDDSANVRMESAHALYLQQKNALPAADALIDAQRDPNKQVRDFAFSTMELLGNDMRGPLKTRLADKNAATRVQAAQLMARLGIETDLARDTLKQELRGRQVHASLQAAIVLASQYHDKSGLFNLQSALKGDADDKRQALQALKEIGPEASPAINEIVACAKDSDVAIRARAVEVLVLMTDRAEKVLPILEDYLRGPDLPNKQALLYKLSEFGAQAVPLLLIGFKDEEHATRAAAATALGTMGSKGKSAIPTLVDSLNKDETPYQAVTALARIDMATAFPLLLKLIAKSESATKRNAALAALKDANSDQARLAVPVLIAHLKSKGGSKHMAIAVLGGYGRVAKEAEPILREIAEGEDEELRPYAEKALEKIADDA